MTDTLSALDATFLELEQLDEGALMSIGGVMVFDPPTDRDVPSIDEVRAHLLERLGQLPRYSQRLSSTRVGGFSWPHWCVDERFDVCQHVHHAALPAPGSDRQLGEWAADFYSHRLDRTRPLWEAVLVEGLEHGRWAIAHKTHHCLVDGVGSVDVANVLLDDEEGADDRGSVTKESSDAEPIWHSLVPTPPHAVGQAAAAGGSVAMAGLHAALHPRTALARSRAFAEVIVRDEIVGAPESSINVPIGPTRRFTVVRAQLAELKAIGRVFGGSVNDVVLAACTSGLRSLLLARGEEPPARGFRAMVPMNVRKVSDRLALGNRISSLFVELPVAEETGRERLRQIIAVTHRLKSSDAASGATAIIDLAALAPPVLHATLARSLYAKRLFNVTVTNVPGPQRPLHVFGARLHEVQPLVPLAAEHAVGIAIFSYDGLLTFGINADSESMPDIDVLAAGIEDGLEELRLISSERMSLPPQHQAS